MDKSPQIIFKRVILHRYVKRVKLTMIAFNSENDNDGSTEGILRVIVCRTELPGAAKVYRQIMPTPCLIGRLSF